MPPLPQQQILPLNGGENGGATVFEPPAQISIGHILAPFIPRAIDWLFSTAWPLAMSGQETLRLKSKVHVWLCL